MLNKKVIEEMLETQKIVNLDDLETIKNSLEAINNLNVAIGRNEIKYQDTISQLEGIGIIANQISKIPVPLVSLGATAAGVPIEVLKLHMQERQSVYLGERDRLMANLSEQEQADIQKLRELLNEELANDIAEREQHEKEKATVFTEVQDFERQEIKKTEELSLVTYKSIGNAFLNSQYLMQGELDVTQVRIKELLDNYLDVIDKIDAGAEKYTDFVYDIKAERAGRSALVYDEENGVYEPGEIGAYYSVKPKKETQIKDTGNEYRSVREYFENDGINVSWSKKDGIKIGGYKIDTSQFKLISGRYMATKSVLESLKGKHDFLSAANGAVIDSNQFAMLHGSKNSPEFVINSPQMRKLLNQVITSAPLASNKQDSAVNLTVQFNVDRVDANSLDDVKTFVDIFTEETLKQLKMGGVNIK